MKPVVPALIAAAVATGRVEPQTPDPRTVSVVYHPDGMERAVVRRAVVYASPGGRDLAFDAYSPPGLRKSDLRPALLFISGAEVVRDWKWYESWGRIAAASGMIGIVPDKRYARGPDGTMAGSDDTAELLGYLLRRGAEFGLDPNRMCLWTFSGGGPMVSVGLRVSAPRLHCMLSFYSALDLSGFVPSSPDSAGTSEFLGRYSPLQVMQATEEARIPPLFIARAGRDSPNLNAAIDRFVAAALRRNLRVTLMNYAEGVHGFDGLNDTAESRAIIRAALEFARLNTLP